MTASKITCKVITKQSLTLYLEYKEKKSQAELMFFLSTMTIARQKNESIEIENSANNLRGLIIAKKKKIANLEDKHDNALETKDITADDKKAYFIG